MNKYLDYTGLTTLVNKIKELIPTVFSGSGTSHSSGLVPDPGATQGTTKYLREDGTWAVPEGGSSVQSDWEQSDSTAVDYIKNKPTIPTVPTNVSSFTNDAGYLTSHQDISGKQNVIDATHKLSADLIEDGTTNKVINVKPDWNAASGSSAEILNKPSIPAAQVQSDWNATSGMGVILNKPTIPTVPNLSKGTTTGSGNAVTDISVSGHTVTLTKGTTFLTSHQDISGKEDKIAINTKSSGTSMTATLGKYYRFTYNVGTLAITLPTPASSTYAQSVIFCFNTGTSPNVTFTSSGNTIYKSDGFSIEASTRYEVNALWNGGAWVIMAVKIS